MIGFVPGQPFLGDLNKSLFHDRLDTPRVKINKGSVGILKNSVLFILLKVLVVGILLEKHLLIYALIKKIRAYFHQEIQ